VGCPRGPADPPKARYLSQIGDRTNLSSSRSSSSRRGGCALRAARGRLCDHERNFFRYLNMTNSFAALQRSWDTWVGVPWGRGAPQATQPRRHLSPSSTIPTATTATGSLAAGTDPGRIEVPGRGQPSKPPQFLFAAFPEKGPKEIHNAGYGGV